MDGWRPCQHGKAHSHYYKFNDLRTMKADGVWLLKVSFRFGRYYRHTTHGCTDCALEAADVRRPIDRYKENESAFDISVHPCRRAAP
jgi:hypothetical protein